MSRSVILIVDDEPLNIDVLRGILEDDYQLKVAINGQMAVGSAKKEPVPDLILMDVMMPKMDGYEACEQLKSDLVTRNIPVIFVTAKSETGDELKGFQAGAADYLTKPVNPLIVKSRVRAHLALHNQRKELDRQVQERTAQISETRLEIIRRLGRAGEFKDNETGLHVIRVSHYASLIARELGLDQTTQDFVMNVTPMHDIGKIGIPDAIITKNGPLTDEERKLINEHPTIGASIIGDHEDELLRFARDASLCHHEKWDGSGYPMGKKGEEIPLIGRIIAVTDVFDALTSRRPYKEPWPVEKAWKLLEEESGKHFDPSVVAAFQRVVSEVQEIRNRFSEE
ncbi:MAG TPA: two-component system response regulator [Spirochaeta sp.]|nr:two-component system response regulator [Spirochaeta sp.]